MEMFAGLPHHHQPSNLPQAQMAASGPQGEPEQPLEALPGAVAESFGLELYLAQETRRVLLEQLREAFEKLDDAALLAECLDDLPLLAAIRAMKERALRG